MSKGTRITLMLLLSPSRFPSLSNTCNQARPELARVRVLLLLVALLGREGGPEARAGEFDAQRELPILPLNNRH